MKNYIILVCIITFPLFSQTTENNSFLSLKQEAINGILHQQHTEIIQVISDIKQKKNTGMAILYSLLLPGMGELYADSYNSGIYFTVADGVLWGTLIGMNIYANWQENRYITYAQTNAGVSTNGKDEDYYATIGEFLDVEQYNNEKALERDFNSLYTSENFVWKWNSTEDRKTYRNMWLSSEQTFNDTRFVVGALILNRVVSAINAVRLVSSYNSKLQKEVSWNLSFGVKTNPTLPTSLTFNYQQAF